MTAYQQFLEQKGQLSGNFGFDPIYTPDFLFDFQEYIVDWAIKKGRAAIFADTGLGKTAMQLTIAQNIVEKTNQNVLILTPLAVAFQFIIEAEKIGIDDIEISKNGKFTKKIVIANYERLKHFNSHDFSALILDESSILKNFDGAIKKGITTFSKKMKYRFLGTATPSPNDFIELGTSSEALGYLGYIDMLGRFFKNNEDTINPINIGAQWVLKAHARKDFWKWVSSWSMSVRKPSDLGFSDEKFKLPKLKIKKTVVKNDKPIVVNGQFSLFNITARNFQEVRAENRATIENRCEKAVELTKNHEISVYWVNLNDEGDLIEQLDKDAVQIKGSMNIDKKEELLIAFSKGDVKKLITKAKMTAFGLNWQHCNHTTYFPTYSYEQYYQAIRRFWRFGQKRDVIADLVYSDGQNRVMTALIAKSNKADEMFTELNKNINSQYRIKSREFDKPIVLPKFLKAQ